MMDLHNDEPALEDRLGRQGMVQRVGDEIADCRPPSVCGIHGEWGSGKTSFLHQIHWYLIGACPEQSEAEQEKAKQRKDPKRSDSDKKLISVVWFEAWRYQHEKDPVVALLHEIRTQLPLYSKWLNEGKKLADVAIRGALMSMEDITSRLFGFKASKIQESGEKYERDHLAVALPSHTIRAHLDQSLGQLLGRKKRGRGEARLVVLIDDLDRCEPAGAFRLLEGIKIYLNLPSCVFVLGMNQRIIERAIAKHTAPDEPEDIRREYACEYLDKLCTDIWHLPLIGNPADPLGAWLPADLPGRERFLKLIRGSRCIAANARKIKSFATILVRFVEDLGFDETQSPALEPGLIILMACLYHDHYELYRRIESEPGFYNHIRRWATGKRHSEHDLTKSLRLPAEFAETDATEREGAPAPVASSTFVDPVRGNVFRLQSLVQALGEVRVSELKRYLLSGRARGQESQSEER